MRTHTFLLLIVFALPATSFGLERGENDVLVRVIDVGTGLCCVVAMPDNHFMIYDAGRWTRLTPEDETEPHTAAYWGIKEMVPDDAKIDLLVLSHGDSDHLGAVKEICDKYEVLHIIHPGFERWGTKTWENAHFAILKESEDTDSCKVHNLKHKPLRFGKAYNYGQTRVEMVCGWHKPPESWKNVKKGTGEYRNAGSIVVRVVYDGKSVLLCGDTVGRIRNSDPENHIAAEKYMVENTHRSAIDSDVLIAGHHGGDNASSIQFIKAVSPEYVIFSAGNDHGHPRYSTAKRFLHDYNMPKGHMFRTDLGGDTRGTKYYKDEWWEGMCDGVKDGPLDDDVDILLSPGKPAQVEYRTAPDPCDN